MCKHEVDHRWMMVEHKGFECCYCRATRRVLVMPEDQQSSRLTDQVMHVRKMPEEQPKDGRHHYEVGYLKRCIDILSTDVPGATPVHAISEALQVVADILSIYDDEFERRVAMTVMKDLEKHIRDVIGGMKHDAL